ncbi:MAG: hypothetical protein HYZ50_00905 [Deltaproteobacteria bacterium]|nr:hypothetical protein [Deltaproteobacteria bacterium]
MTQGSWKSWSMALVTATGLAIATLGLSACGKEQPAEPPANPAAAAKDAAATAVGKMGEAAQTAGDAVKKAADEAEKEMKKDQ